MGCALACGVRTNWRGSILRLAPFALAGASVVLAGFFFADQGLIWRGQRFYLPTVGFSFIALAGASLVACSLRSGSLIQNVLKQSWLRFFGRYSYGLYVFHYVLDSALTKRLRPLLASHLHSKMIGVVGSALIVFGITIVVAMLSFRFFESPILRLKRYFAA